MVDDGRLVLGREHQGTGEDVAGDRRLFADDRDASNRCRPCPAHARPIRMMATIRP